MARDRPGCRRERCWRWACRGRGRAGRPRPPRPRRGTGRPGTRPPGRPRRRPPGRGCGSTRPSRPPPRPAAPRASRTRRGSGGTPACPSPPRRSGSSRPRRPRSAFSWPDQHVARRTPPRCAPANSRSNGITTSSSTSRPAIRSRLIGIRGHELGQRLGVDDGERVRVEGQDRVHPADHLAVAQMDAVEGADRHAARARGVDFGQRGDLHPGRNTTTGWISAPRGSPMATTSPPCIRRTRGVHRAGHSAAVADRLGLLAGQLASRHEAPARRRAAAAGRHPRPRAGRARWRCARAARSRRRPARRSAAARRCRTSTRARTRPRSPSWRDQLGAVHRDRPRGKLGGGAGAGELVRPGARPPSPPSRPAGAASARRPAARAAPAGCRCARASRRDRRCRSASRALPCAVGLRQPHQEALGAGGGADQDEQQARGERVERSGVADLRAPSAVELRTRATTSWEVTPSGLG